MGAIGTEAIARILAVSDELAAVIRDRFEPYEGIYRIDDFEDYASEEDWENAWANRPPWWRRAWMLADNGQLATGEAAAMSVEDVEAPYDGSAFEPEYASTPRPTGTACRRYDEILAQQYAGQGFHLFTTRTLTNPEV